MARAYFGLARWGITLILPESLPAFQEIVIADRRMNRGEQLAALAVKICEAICREKYTWVSGYTRAYKPQAICHG